MLGVVGYEFWFTGSEFSATTHTANVVLDEMECDSLMGFACFLFLLVGCFVFIFLLNLLVNYREYLLPLFHF